MTPQTVSPEPLTRGATASTEQVLYGLMAEFKSHEELLAAAKESHAAGYRRMDAFSPFPVDGLAEALGHECSIIPFVTLAGGIIGGLGAYFMQWYSMDRLYALNIGGRPLHSWPHFIPITFELTILIASISAFIAVLVLNRLPEPNHPVFNVPEFRRASIDRFFLCIETVDPKFDFVVTRAFLQRMNPLAVAVVNDE
jgi:hypothetical protein